VKFKHIPYVIVVVFLALLVVAPERYTHPISNFLVKGFTPVCNLITTVKIRFFRISDNLKSLESISEDNQKMRKELAKLRTENDRLKELEQENNKLKQMLGFVQNSAYDYVAARVIARDSSNWWQGLHLDVGLKHNRRLGPNMAVVTEDGLVGKTTTIFEDHCKMVLIVDENCKVSTTIKESREQGIVMGMREATEAAPILKMTYISRKAEILHGQTVVTSGLGSVFPPNIPIGSITEIRTASKAGSLGLYREALIKPVVDLSNLETVFIVVGRK